MEALSISGPEAITQQSTGRPWRGNSRAFGSYMDAKDKKLQKLTKQATAGFKLPVNNRLSPWNRSTPLAPMEFSQKLADEVMSHMKRPSDEFHKRDVLKEYEIHQLKMTVGCDLLRIRKKMACSASSLISVVSSSAGLASCDKSIRGLLTFHEFEDGAGRIVYRIFTPGFPLKDRDVCDFMCEREEGNLIICASSSVPFLTPEQKGLIRAEVGLFAIVAEPLPGNTECNLTLLCQADMKGDVPKSIVVKEAAIQFCSVWLPTVEREAGLVPGHGSPLPTTAHFSTSA